MPYMRNSLISRSGYSGVGDWWDDVSSAAGSVLDFYNKGQQSAGAAQANRDLLLALQAQQQGPGIGTIALIGGAGLIAFLLLRKKG